jgi:hypothetical protein
MRGSLRRLGVLLVAVFVAALLPATSASGADTSTDVPLACVSTFPFSPSGTLTIGTSVPDTVAQGSAFVLEVTPSGFFNIPAPYSGTISASWTLSASAGVTPSGQFVVSLSAQHFSQGQMTLPFGTFPTSFVASGSAGTFVEFRFSEFTYTITPDSLPTSFTVTCRPLVTPGPIVGSTMITAAECNGASPTISGTPGDDIIVGTSAADVIDGQGGNDTIRGLSGNDVICGDDGDDTIYGGSGHDVIVAGAGNDTVFGDSGNDHLFGEADNDTLAGGSGNDDLDGGSESGPPADACDGGTGTDVAAACETIVTIP